MNKNEFVSALADKSGIAGTKANEIVDHFFAIVTDALSKGEEIAFVGFGTFKAVKRAERNARNIKTGEPIKVPATTVAKFSAGKKLKDAVSGK